MSESNTRKNNENTVPLCVLGISFSQTHSGAYALVLGEENGNRRIPIIIGGFEAQSIAIHLEGLKTPRPLTHDLLYNFAVEYGIIVESVFIFRMEEGIFYSRIACTNGGKKVELDARASDAIALALRFGCPIYTTKEIVERAGIVLANAPEQQQGQFSHTFEKKKKSDLQYMDVSELEFLLNEAIIKEDYEQASKIRDEIKKRKRS